MKKILFFLSFLAVLLTRPNITHAQELPGISYGNPFSVTQTCIGSQDCVPKLNIRSDNTKEYDELKDATTHLTTNVWSRLRTPAEMNLDPNQKFVSEEKTGHFSYDVHKDTQCVTNQDDKEEKKSDFKTAGYLNQTDEVTRSLQQMISLSPSQPPTPPQDPTCQKGSTGLDGNVSNVTIPDKSAVIGLDFWANFSNFFQSFFDTICSGVLKQICSSVFSHKDITFDVRPKVEFPFGGIAGNTYQDQGFERAFFPPALGDSQNPLDKKIFTGSDLHGKGITDFKIDEGKPVDNKNQNDSIDFYGLSGAQNGYTVMQNYLTPPDWQQ